MVIIPFKLEPCITYSLQSPLSFVTTQSFKCLSASTLSIAPYNIDSYVIAGTLVQSLK